MGHDIDVLYVRQPERASTLQFGDGRTAVHEAASLGAALATLDDVPVDCVVCESRLDAVDGLDVLAAVRERNRTVPFLLVADEADGLAAAEATRLGVSEYVPRDSLGDETVSDRVAAALETASAEPTLDSLHAVADSISNAVLAITADSEIVFANEAVSDLTGYDREELIGEPLTTIIPERLRESHHDGIASYLETNERSIDWNYVELPMERADGRERTVAVSFGEFSRDGERYFTGSLRDVTERKKREETLSSLLDTSNALFDADSRDAITDLVTTTAAEILGFEINAVFRHDEATDRLVPTAVSDETREVLDDLGSVATGDSRLGEAFNAGESLIVNDLDYDPALGSLLALPLGSHGVLAIGAQSSGAFDDTDRQLAELLTTTATSALDRMIRVESIERLHHQTRAMLRADGKEAVCRVALEAAREVLGHPMAGVHLYDPDRDTLEPTVWTDELETLVGMPPTFDRDEGLAWEAYRSGEPKVYDDVTRHGAFNPESPVASELHLPLGDHGILIAGEPDEAAFGRTDLQLARLLAANAAVALDRVDRETELRRFETVFENVQDMLFVVDEDGQLTNVTAPLAERLGLDRSALVGKHVSAVLDEESVERGQELTRALLLNDERTSATYETTLLTTDGDAFPVEIELSLLPGTRFTGTVGTVRDLSDLERARTKLRTERNRFEYLFDNIPDAVVEVKFVDGEPIVQSVNDAFADVFGYEPTTVLGESLNDHILLPEQRGEAEALDRRASDEVVREELRRLTAAGARQFLFRGLSYTDGSETYGFGIYTDITEQQMRHRQLEVLNRVLRHNLRNDLNVVVGLADQIAAEASSETIAESARTLAATAGDLVDLSNKARDAEQLLDRKSDSTWVDACEVVESAVSAAHDRYGDATIGFDAPGETRIAGDERLRVAVENLLENAVEHNDGDRPRVEVAIDTAVDGERVAVRVADDGPGVPDHEQAIVTGEAEITPLQHASGLGLWLVAWIVDAYGGTVTFDDSDLGGTEVSLLLPRLKQTAEEGDQ